jgi:ATP/ADP translocase
MTSKTRTTVLIAIVVVILAGLVIWNVYGYKQSKTSGIIASVMSPVVLIVLGVGAIWLTFSNIDND